MQSYFSHDADALSDPKLVLLRCKYDWAGYGIYWAIIEKLRNEKNYRYPKKNIKALAKSLDNYDLEKLEIFIADCINEFTNGEGEGLFKSDDNYFWSASLIERMQVLEQAKKLRSINGRYAANQRWAEADNTAANYEEITTNTDVMPMQCNSNADAMPSDAIKLNKIKENKIKSNNIKLNKKDSGSKMSEEDYKNKIKDFFKNVENYRDNLDNWEETFIGLDVKTEIRKAYNWLLSNPHRQKSRFVAFVNNWLNKSYERYLIIQQVQNGKSPPVKSAMQKNLEEFQQYTQRRNKSP